MTRKRKQETDESVVTTPEAPQPTPKQEEKPAVRRTKLGSGNTRVDH